MMQNKIKNQIKKEFLYGFPREYSLIVIPYITLFYLLTENVFLSFLNAVAFYSYGRLKTQENRSWTKNIIALPIVRFFLILYVPLLALLTIKIINL